MLSRGAAKKVTIYVNEDTRHHHGDALWSALMRFLRNKHVAGATALRPMAGFGPHEVIHSPDQEAHAEHMPVRIEFIDTAEKVDELLPALYEMVEDGLIEVQDTNVVKAVMKGKKPPAPAPHAEIAAPGKMLRIYLGEADKLNGEPLFEAIVKLLLMMEVAGATVYKGILGYGVKRHTHKEGRFRISSDAPIMISIVDRPERVDEILDAVTPIMQDGLIVVSDVEMRKFVRTLPDPGMPHASSTTS